MKSKQIELNLIIFALCSLYSTFPNCSVPHICRTLYINNYDDLLYDKKKKKKETRKMEKKKEEE